MHWLLDSVIMPVLVFVVDTAGDMADSGVTGWSFIKFILLMLFIGIYFIPFSIAQSRHCNSRFGVFCVNLLIGWTLIGWFAAIIWACASPVRERT
jgi:hypothetical protein